MLKTFALLAAVASPGLAFPTAAPTTDVGFSPVSKRLVPWDQAQCTQEEITDAAYLPDARWIAVDSQTAWEKAAEAFANQNPGPNMQYLPFTPSMSNFFHGPEHMNCQDIGDGTCNTAIQCHDTSHPAGYLILNSFVSIHQIHQNRYNGLDTALNLMQSSIGKFTETFAPQLPGGNLIIREILSSFAFIVGLGSAYSWNRVIKSANIFSNDDWRGVSKDAFNSAITFAVASARDHLPTAGDLQNDLNEAMGAFVERWLDAEAEYVNRIFSGDEETLYTLWALLRNGVQNALPLNTDLATLKDEAQKIIYAKMIPAAWASAPGDFHPFIIATDNACTERAEGALAGHMSDGTAAGTRVCYDNKIFYVVTPNYTNQRGRIAKWALDPLPGGTHEHLKGGQWAGVELDDLVISSWDGFKLNGFQNGYQIPEDTKAIDGNGGQGDLIFEAGIRTPGFTSLPVCDVDTFLKTISKCNGGGAAWPCSCD